MKRGLFKIKVSYDEEAIIESKCKAKELDEALERIRKKFR